MRAARRLLFRLYNYVFPMHDWARRVKQFRHGKIAWSVPDRPDIGNFGPWPLEWIEVEIPKVCGEKLIFKDGVSAISGLACSGDDAVRCARCGISLHVAEANMMDSLSVPACSWCVGSVHRA
jgi:hypothetical protein